MSFFFFGAFLAPGGTRIDDNDKTKMTNHCVFFADEDHDAIRNYAQVSKGVVDYCFPFMYQKGLQWNICRLSRLQQASYRAIENPVNQ